jgi:hypothetical protein
VRLAIATGTGPADWGLDLDWQTMLTFEVELTEQAAAASRQAGLRG